MLLLLAKGSMMIWTPPHEEVQDEEYSVDYTSDEMNDEDESDYISEDEEVHQGIQDLGNAIQPSSDDEEEDEGEPEMPVHDDGPDLRAFNLFAPSVQRPCLDDEGRELTNTVYERMLATWYFPCGSAYQGQRLGETYRESMATEKLLQQEVDLMKCIYCSRSQCGRLRHYLMNVILSNMRESQDMATDKSLDEVSGTHVHSAKECACMPVPFVDLGGRNLGSLSHRLFCVKRSRLELSRLAEERRVLEINPHLERVRQAALKVIRNGVDLKPCIKENKHVLARMITQYKSNLESASDMVGLQDSHHSHESTHSESENNQIPDMSRHIIE